MFSLKLFKKTGFRLPAATILKESDLLIKEDTMIIDGILFEKLSPQERNNKRYQNCMYRFFTDVDDYDYLEKGRNYDTDKLITALDALWACRDSKNVTIEDLGYKPPTKLEKVLKFCNRKFVFTWSEFLKANECEYPSTETNYLSMLVKAQYIEKTGHGQYQVNIRPAQGMGWGQLKRESEGTRR